MQIKADLHVHTIYSNDSVISPEDLVFYAKKCGLNAVAITDHNQVDSALNIAKETDFPIIPGIEISSMHGHILGLNVKDTIPKGLSSDETVDRIHKLGGIAVACHPFALFKGGIGKYATVKFDAIETINASIFPFRRSTRKANDLADKLNLPRVAGTDAHYGPLVGWAHTVVEAELTVDSIIEALANGQCQPVGRAISWAMRLENHGRFFWKYFKHKGRKL